jgi:hydrogenase maturation protease
MNRAAAHRLAQALLYEGYLLYPYRPSVKNRERWTPGALPPGGGEVQTQVLVVSRGRPVLDVEVRFLQAVERTVGELSEPVAQLPDTLPPYRPVTALEVGGALYQNWQGAVEREVILEGCALEDLARSALRKEIAFAASRRVEPIAGSQGEIVGLLVREQKALRGIVSLCADAVAEGTHRLTLRVRNETGVEQTPCERGALFSFAALHSLIAVREGELVSCLDPPPDLRPLVAACENTGTFPVLLGEEGEADALLSSPILLYDHPHIAPESAGDFFDGTEIDEMLALRILTLTAEEKRAMLALDERSAALLRKTEALTGAELLELHGAVRGLRPPSGG